MLTMYGIPNCDSCRKARKWMDANSVEHRFHDFRVDGLEEATLARWAEIGGWQSLLNTRSTTWREIPKAERHPMSEKRALELLLQQPTLIKRPVLELKTKLLVGFSDQAYAGADLS